MNKKEPQIIDNLQLEWGAVWLMPYGEDAVNKTLFCIANKWVC